MTSATPAAPAAPITPPAAPASAPAAQAPAPAQPAAESVPAEPAPASEAADPPATEPDSSKPEADDPYAGIALPEDTLLDQEALDTILAFAREHELEPEIAQALLQREHDWEIDNVRRNVERANAWYDEIAADPDWGGDKLDANRSAAKAFISKWWGGDFLQALADSGLGNEPRFLRGIFKLAKSVAEPQQLVRGGLAGAATGQLNVEKLWPVSGKDMLKMGAGY